MENCEKIDSGSNLTEKSKKARDIQFISISSHVFRRFNAKWTIFLLNLKKKIAKTRFSANPMSYSYSAVY